MVSRSIGLFLVLTAAWVAVDDVRHIFFSHEAHGVLVTSRDGVVLLQDVVLAISLAVTAILTFLAARRSGGASPLPSKWFGWNLFFCFTLLVSVLFLGDWFASWENADSAPQM